MKVHDLVSDIVQDKDYKPVETFQDVFNNVVNHLIVQNKKSWQDDTSSCRYRAYNEGEEYRKCAIGCLISDNNYHEYIEDSLANSPDVIEAIKKSNSELIVDDQMKELFLLLQYVHDSIEPENWIYMSFLVWRDMNRFISYRSNKGYGDIKDFPGINDFDGQKEMYKQTAERMTLTDFLTTSTNAVLKQKDTKTYNMRDMYLEQLKSDNPKSPIEFFKERRIKFQSLIKSN
jgi:uncharacterized short protein YbdD (DUF466 family)